MCRLEEWVCLKCVAVLRSEKLHAFISDVHRINVLGNLSLWAIMAVHVLYSHGSYFLFIFNVLLFLGFFWFCFGFFCTCYEHHRPPKWFPKRIRSFLFLFFSFPFFSFILSEEEESIRRHERGFTSKNKTSTVLLKRKLVDLFCLVVCLNTIWGSSWCSCAPGVL